MEWISVEDSMPPCGDYALIYGVNIYSYRGVFMAILHPDGHSWYRNKSMDEDYIDVTHWQPLPEPPQKLS